MKVKEIMSRPIVTEGGDTNIYKLIEILEKLGVGSVVITKDGEPVGIVTERDLISKVMFKDKKPSDFCAKEIMSSPLVTIDPEAPISDASKLMVEKRIRRLPVVEKGSLIGLISVRNILSETPECVKRLYPKVHALISAFLLEKIEVALIKVEQLLTDSKNEDFEDYSKGLERIHKDMNELITQYEGDGEMGALFKQLDEFCKKKDDLPLGEHKEKLSDILKDLRHVICWRKLKTPSGFSSGLLPFSDFKGLTGSSVRLPK